MPWALLETYRVNSLHAVTLQFSVPEVGTSSATWKAPPGLHFASTGSPLWLLVPSALITAQAWPVLAPGIDPPTQLSSETGA